MSYGKSVLQEITPLGRELRKAIPDTYAGFSALLQGAMSDGVLDVKTKELIALAIGVSKQCDGCIAAHARGAAKAGATREEVAEALGVAVLMNGGPATVYGPRALEAFDEFAGEAG
ncbi:MAG: alkylhydroperoxidase [Gammaproteobacteria bacterium]|nr:MAG: alkylhydroperoxidase [Gammaproteobacteria bacterium]